MTGTESLWGAGRVLTSAGKTTGGCAGVAAGVAVRPGRGHGNTVGESEGVVLPPRRRTEG